MENELCKSRESLKILEFQFTPDVMLTMGEIKVCKFRKRKLLKSFWGS